MGKLKTTKKEKHPDSNFLIQIWEKWASKQANCKGSKHKKAWWRMNEWSSARYYWLFLRMDKQSLLLLLFSGGRRWNGWMDGMIGLFQKIGANLRTGGHWAHTRHSLIHFTAFSSHETHNRISPSNHPLHSSFIVHTYFRFRLHQFVKCAIIIKSSSTTSCHNAIPFHSSLAQKKTTILAQFQNSFFCSHLKICFSHSFLASSVPLCILYAQIDGKLHTTHIIHFDGKQSPAETVTIYTRWRWTVGDTRAHQHPKPARRVSIIL